MCHALHFRVDSKNCGDTVFESSDSALQQLRKRRLCGNFLVRIAVVAALTIPLSVNAHEQVSDGQSDTAVVRLGILNTIGELSSSRIFADTVRSLEQAWDCKIQVSYYDLDTLPAAVHDKKLDFFIANAGTFSFA